MKKILLAIFISISSFAFAQPDKFAMGLMNTPYIAFEEQQISFRGTIAPSIAILITSDEVAYQKDWKNWLKSKYAIEAKKNDGYFSAENLTIAEWSAEPLNLHYKTDKDGDAVRLNVLIEQKGVFLSEKSHADIISKVKNSISIQVKEFYVKYYDEKIADQQKFYDNQIDDMAKLTKKKEKLNGNLASNSKSISKTEDAMRTTNSNVVGSDGKVKSLNSQLQHDQKAAEQAQKEVDNQRKLIGEKEAEYNRLNAAGSLNSKEGERAMKDLEKLRSKNTKLESTLAKANETVTKSENNILKEEQNKTKLLSKLEDLKSTKDKLNSETSDLKRDLENNESAIKDEQLQIDAARVDMDKLKAAKIKLVEGK